MDTILIWILPTIGGLILYALINAGTKAPGLSLSNKFASLGILQGKTLKEIIDVCGNPNSYSSTIDANGNPVKIIQWMAAGYHIVLLFDANDICLGVSSETMV